MKTKKSSKTATLKAIKETPKQVLELPRIFSHDRMWKNWDKLDQLYGETVANNLTTFNPPIVLAPTAKPETTSNEAKHFDSGKPELQYIFAMVGLHDVARVGSFGARKYGQWNYKAGMNWMKLLGSCSRHLVAFICREDNDPESGLSHLAHLIYDALMLLEYLHDKKGTDDRYRTEVLI